MRLSLRNRAPYAIGAVILSPALLYASGHVCRMVDAEPTPETYTWNFTKEGSQLLEQIDRNIQMVKDDAAALKRQDAELDWKTHSIVLTRIKDQVNKTGEELCRMEMIQHTLEPWQQQALARIAPELDVLAKNTQNAIEFLQDNRQSLFNPTYEEYLGNIYDRAERVNLFVEYAQVRQEVDQSLQPS